MSDRETVLEFIRRGEEISQIENRSQVRGLNVVNGPKFDEWMSAINIFNSRKLKTHPLHEDIYTTYFHRQNMHAFDNMMGHLKALANDTEYWESAEQKVVREMTYGQSLASLLADDIERLESYLRNPTGDSTGQALYTEITSKYDAEIPGLGNGLYQYIAAHHFYDPSVSGSSLQHNLKVVLNKLKTYQAKLQLASSSSMGANQKAAHSRKGKQYDVFISHANADKSPYVNELKTSIDKLGIKVFYDIDTLEWGDNWKEKILEGVREAEFAIIVISENFFDREWTERELQEFLSRQNINGQKIVLPILHNISVAQLQKKYPAVADIQALDSSKYTCDEIALLFARQLINRLR